MRPYGFRSSIGDARHQDGVSFHGVRPQAGSDFVESVSIRHLPENSDSHFFFDGNLRSANFQDDARTHSAIPGT